MNHSLFPAEVEKDGKVWQRRGKTIETSARCSHTGLPQGYRPLAVLSEDKLSFETITEWCCDEHHIEYLEALYEQTLKQRDYFYNNWQESKEACEKFGVGSLAPADIVYAATLTENYSASRIILAETGKKGWTVFVGGHCSCWGFENEKAWTVDEYTGAEMDKLMEGWKTGTEDERTAAAWWFSR